VDAIERANGLLALYADLARAELPPGSAVFDAHTHLGEDIDGMTGDPGELLPIQRAYRVTRSNVFCLDEPDRHPAFRAANDRTLAYAADAADDELVPYVRLDLDETPVEEATRCIDLGARGWSLIPRAPRSMQRVASSTGVSSRSSRTYGTSSSGASAAWASVRSFAARNAGWRSGSSRQKTFERVTRYARWIGSSSPGSPVIPSMSSPRCVCASKTAEPDGSSARARSA